MQRIALQGNISVGKSTILAEVEDRLPVVYEPVHLWEDYRGSNCLKNSIENPKRWLFHFQSLVQLSIVKSQRHSSIGPTIYERSLDTVKFVFLPYARSKSLLEDCENHLLDEYYNLMTETFQILPHHHIYLRASAKTCFERLQKRGRQSEVSINLECLQVIHNLHEHWLLGREDVTIIDAEGTDHEIRYQVHKTLDKLMQTTALQ